MKYKAFYRYFNLTLAFPVFSNGVIVAVVAYLNFKTFYLVLQVTNKTNILHIKINILLFVLLKSPNY